jgi:hypothetical protein
MCNNIEMHEQSANINKGSNERPEKRKATKPNEEK